MSDVVTGEAVPLELRLAKLPSRALAVLIDWAVLTVLAVLLLTALGALVPAADPALGTALAIAGVVLVTVAVPAAVETATRGSSLGKAALGLRVVRDDGGPIGFRHALVRALAGVFVDFVGTVGVAAVMCSLLSSRDKRVGDVLAGTVVVRERFPRTRAPALRIDPELESWAATADLSQLPDELALAARTLLSRAPQLTAEVRERLAADMATRVAAHLHPAPPAGTAALPYLAAVLGERRRRELDRHAASPAPHPGPSHPEGMPPAQPGTPPLRPGTPPPGSPDSSGFVPPA